LSLKLNNGALVSLLYRVDGFLICKYNIGTQHSYADSRKIDFEIENLGLFIGRRM